MGIDNVLSLCSEDEREGFSVLILFIPSFPASLFSPSAMTSICIVTVLLSAPTALLAVHS